MGDSTGVSVSLGEISLEGNKSWESNIGDSDNTGDGGKIAGKITVVILVTDRCPRGKGSLRIFLRKGLLLEIETLKSVPKPVESKPKGVSELKIWSDAPVIEEYESDSDDEYVFKASVEQEKSSCAFINTVKHVKTPRQTVKDQDTCSQNLKVPKRVWTDLMSKRLGLGYGTLERHALYVDNPHQTLKGKGIVDSGCSKHMTGNKAYHVEYQDFNGGPIAFRGSKGQIAGKGPTWLFDLDYLTDSINYQPVTVENKANITTGQKKLILVQSSKAKNGDEKLNGDIGSKTNKEPDLLLQAGAARASSTNYVNTASTPVNTTSTPVNPASPSRNIPSLKDIYKVQNDGIFTSATYDDEGAVADFTNLESTVNEKLLQFKTQQVWILVDLPFRKKEKLLQFKTQQVWILVDLPFRKKDERGALVRNKARLVAQGHRQEEGVDYDEVFAPVARIKAIRIFLAFASYMGFIVYHMDVKSAFLYGKIDEEVYVSQPPGLIDPKFPKKVYKVVKALNGLHQAPRAWYATLSTFLVQSGYKRGLIDKTLFIKKDTKDIMLVKQKEDGTFISHDKYVAEILKKFDFISMKIASTLIETKKPLVKDAKAADVDVHLYRSMIGSLMYLTASRLDIIYAVCACSRFQVTLKTSHLHAVKGIFRYLKFQPTLGLWYPRESAFDLESYSYSDYGGANLDRKSTTGLISWQETYFMAVQKANNYSYIFYRGRVCCCCNTPKLGRSGILGLGRVTS
nr:hypothetical protein [Tanacetum cinerariifolium]